MASGRRPNNDGTIYFRDGRKKPWIAQLSIGQGKRISKSFHTQREAINWLNVAKIEFGSRDTSVTQMFIGDAIEEWLADGQIHYWDASTYRSYSGTYNRHIEPYLNRKLRVRDVKPSYIRNLITMNAKLGKGQRTLEEIKGIFSRFYTRLIEDRSYDFNPATSLPKYYKLPKVNRDNILSEDEIIAFLTEARNSRLYFLYYLALETGMRLGELLGLMWHDINWEEQMIHVRRALVQSGEGRVLDEPKTDNSIREIPFDISLVEEFKVHQQRLRSEQAGVKRYSNTDLVFPSTVGTPMNPSNLYKNFYRFLDKANVRRIHFHDLRHTAASIWIALGVRIENVSKRLGHSSFSFTHNMYVHIIPNSDREVARPIGDYFADLADRATDDNNDAKSDDPNAAKLQQNDETDKNE